MLWECRRQIDAYGHHGVTSGSISSNSVHIWYPFAFPSEMLSKARCLCPTITGWLRNQGVHSSWHYRAALKQDTWGDECVEIWNTLLSGLECEYLHCSSLFKPEFLATTCYYNYATRKLKVDRTVCTMLEVWVSKRQGSNLVAAKESRV